MFNFITNFMFYAALGIIVGTLVSCLWYTIGVNITARKMKPKKDKEKNND